MFSDQYLAGFKAARGLETAVKAAYDAQSWAKHAGDGGGISGAVAERICQYLEPLLDHEDYARAEEMIYECVDAGEDGASEHDDQYSSRRGREGVDPYSHDRRRARDNQDADVERLARDRGRRLGRDEPPPFNQMPVVGKGPLNGGRFGSQDRRGRAMDAILATGPAMAFDRKLARIDRNRESFFTKFPDARRLEIV